MGSTASKLVVTAALLATVLKGCAGGDGAQPSTLSLPSMPDLASVASISGPESADPAGSATELYTRIARGAVGCWFGSSGGLKKAYIYHAEADAPSRGGKAEITVHERDPSQPNPRGAKAYKVKIDPKNATTASVATENLKMPEPLATGMTADVERWSRGEQGCSGATTALGWSPDEAAAKAAEQGQAKKGGTGVKKAKAAAAKPKP